MGYQLQIWIQLQIHICVVPFEGPLHLWFQCHLCFTLDRVGVNSRSSSRLGSTPFLAPVPSMSCLRSCGGQLWIRIQLQIHICVVPFEGPLHPQLESHLCLTLDHVGVNSGSGSSSRSIFVLYLLRVHCIPSSSSIYVSPEHMSRVKSRSSCRSICGLYLLT